MPYDTINVQCFARFKGKNKEPRKIHANFRSFFILFSIKNLLRSWVYLLFGSAGAHTYPKTAPPPPNQMRSPPQSLDLKGANTNTVVCGAGNFSQNMPWAPTGERGYFRNETPVNNLWAIDDTAKGGLTQFWELFTVIHCAPKDFKHY